MWRLRLLGRFEVLSPEGRHASFRSRKVGSLLAFLALNRGRPIANATLHDLLWPESDGDRQSQSLRRAIADLRDTFGEESDRQTIVRTEHSTTALDWEKFESDTDRFQHLVGTASNDELYATHVTEALALYGGSLLAPFDEDWVFAYRRMFEEAYCRAILEFCDYLGQRGQGKEAARIAHAAIVLAPMREEPYIAAIRAYASQDIRASALRQFEALEQMLDDQFGQTPSDAALAALDEPAFRAHSYQPEESPSGGAIDGDSRYYVVRKADEQVEEAINAGESVVLVFGPRQVGKTSLIARSTARRSSQTQVVITDFQSLGKSEVGRQATLYRSLIHSFASQLGLPYEPNWNEWVGANSNLHTQIDSLLKQTTGQVVWAMDEVDRVFGTEFADDFFGLVRSWHNRRALEPDGPWKRLTLLISYATEAHLFIKDLNQSPFNIGIKVNLMDFSREEVQDLGNRYGPLVATKAEEVFQLTAGHPFLTRRAFMALQVDPSMRELRESAASLEGPFGDHLRRIQMAISGTAVVADELRRFLKGESFAEANTGARLVAGGLLKPIEQSKLAFRVPVYEHVFSHWLD